MRTFLRFTLSACSFSFFVGAVSACGSGAADSGGGSDMAGTPSPSPSDPGTTDAEAARAIAEADIIQLADARLYAMSKSGTVSVVDVSTPGALTMLGQTTIVGRPFEMYLRDGVLVAMSNAARDANGSTITTAQPTQPPDPNGGAAVVVLDVHDPAHIATLATLAVAGEVADSRIVGNVLYLATYENAQCFGCGATPRTMLTSFDVSVPSAMRQVDQLSFASNAPDEYNLPWGSAWKRSIVATPQRLYIGGHADIAPNSFDTTVQDEGIIDVVDITDPSGRLTAGARLRVAGAVLSRWQLDETDGILRVISQRGAGRTGNGVAMPQIETFTIESTDSFVALGRTTMTLPRQEGLRTVRFDGARAYAITYNQTDPLFTIDLSNPSAPLQRGQLSMPGFMFYLEPHGDRLIGLGIDRTDPGGSVNVSLFDVSDADAPRMLARVPFGTAGLGEDYQILNYELPEDQDRIQKAFRVFPDGLVAVPFSATSGGYGVSNGCANMASGVQLVAWQSDTLVRRALLPIAGNPRREFEKDGDMIAVSDSNVRRFSLAHADVSSPTADLVIGQCVPDALPNSSGYMGGGDYPYEGGWGGRRGGYACALGEPGTGRGAGLVASSIAGLLGVLVAWRRRRA